MKELALTTGMLRFILLSEHEGSVLRCSKRYCGTPALAHAAAAVLETSAAPGCSLPRKIWSMRRTAGMLAFDDQPRARVIARQRERLADFSDRGSSRRSPAGRAPR